MESSDEENESNLGYNEEKKTFTFDLSGLSEEQKVMMRESIQNTMKSIMLAVEVGKSNPDVADIMLKKVTRTTETSLWSSNSFAKPKEYTQKKQGGINVHHLTVEAEGEDSSVVDQAIIDKEHDHKLHLQFEDGNPIWHKTAVQIWAEYNPWPFYKLRELEDALRNDDTRILRQAELRMHELVLGKLAPNYEQEITSEKIVKQLSDAEEGNRSVELTSNDSLGSKSSVALVDLKDSLNNTPKLKQLTEQLVVTEQVKVHYSKRLFSLVIDRQEGGSFSARFKGEKKSGDVLSRGLWNKQGLFKQKKYNPEEVNQDCLEINNNNIK